MRSSRTGRARLFEIGEIAVGAMLVVARPMPGLLRERFPGSLTGVGIVLRGCGVASDD